MNRNNFRSVHCCTKWRVNTIKFSDDKRITVRKKLNARIKFRTFSGETGELFDNEFIIPNSFQLLDLFLKSVTVTEVFANRATSISKLQVKSPPILTNKLGR